MTPLRGLLYRASWIYHKGDDDNFNGLVFIKFASAALRDARMGTYNSKKFVSFGKTSYMNPDLPIQDRVPKTLLNVKKLFVRWGFNVSSVRFDETSCVLSVGGVPLGIVC